MIISITCFLTDDALLTIAHAFDVRVIFDVLGEAHDVVVQADGVDVRIELLSYYGF